MRVLSCVLSLILVASVAVALDQTDFVGEWEMNVDVKKEDKRKTRTVTLVIEEQDGSLAGVWKSKRHHYPLEGLTIDGAKISFSFTRQSKDQTIPSKYVGTLEGSRLRGKLSAAGSSAPASGVRKDG